MSVSFVNYSQSDTVFVNDNDLDRPISYSAKDSIFMDVDKKQVHLFGEAQVDDGEINMKAGYILIDLGKKEVFATYRYDKDSNRIELPVFKDGNEEMTAASIRYNFGTEKGYIEELAVRQDEMYLYMETAKRHKNEEIHFKKGRFTTCDLPDPHYHFQLSKAIMIPDKRIVTGPLNLYIKGVPTPLGLPFAVIPQQKERTHGILFPELVPISQYGFGFQNLGYYIPVNDRIAITPYVSLLSRGSWGARTNVQYAKIYGYTGNLDVGMQQFRLGFPTDEVNNKISVSWIHRQDAKANPYWNFSSNVNFISDNQSKNNLDPLNPDYFNNTFNSDLNVNRNFPGKPVTMGMKISVRQNSLSKNIALVSPVLNVNVSRFFPFKKWIKGTGEFSQIFSRLGITYSMEGRNQSTFGDSLLTEGDFNSIGQQFMNGFNQQMTIQTTASLFKGKIKFTPSLSYGNKINFQQIEKSYDLVSNSFISDTISKAGMAHNLSMNAQLTTVVYSYYKFVGKKKPILRHLLTPSVGIRYTPQLNNIDSVTNTLSNITYGYSPFERSVYSSTSGKTSGLLTFGVNNTFELKRKSDKDTVTGFAKTRIIDALSITGSYDFMKDSMRLSDFNFSLRIAPLPFLNIVANATLSPYNWIDSTGKTTSTYALSNGRAGRFTNTNITTTLTLTSKESREKLSTTQNAINQNWNSDYNYYALHPEYLINFEIPWKASFSHVYSIDANQQKAGIDDKDFNQIQTVVFNGDVSFTKRWKIATILNLDLQRFAITNTRLVLSRDMHCWAMSFNWTPIGFNKSFMLSIRNTSSIFNSAKFDIKKPPLFL
ncbi:MAG: putative LPS assembly protein LptD [Bacteroidota bacterium]